MPKRYQYILFDFDGTLLDTKEAMAYCLESICQSHRHPIPSPPAIDAALAKACDLENTIRSIYPALPQAGAELHSWIHAYETTYAQIEYSHSQLFAGITDLLHTLTVEGYHLVIASNKSQLNIQNMLEHFKLSHYFSHVFSLDNGLPAKPNPQLFHQAILPALKQTCASSFIMIGDTETDIKFAHNCQIDCIWAAYGYGDDTRCKALSPRATIQEPDELLAFV